MPDNNFVPPRKPPIPPHLEAKTEPVVERPQQVPNSTDFAKPNIPNGVKTEKMPEIAKNVEKKEQKIEKKKEKKPVNTKPLLWFLLVLSVAAIGYIVFLIVNAGIN